MAKRKSDQPTPADVLVTFGITGDLAKVMTFHSLYRLEKRPARCPDRRRRGRPLQRRRSAQAGERGDRGQRRGCRPGSLRPVRGATFKLDPSTGVRYRLAARKAEGREPEPI